jgi:hypothetical protein
MLTMLVLPLTLPLLPHPTTYTYYVANPAQETSYCPASATTTVAKLALVALVQLRVAPKATGSSRDASERSRIAAAAAKEAEGALRSMLLLHAHRYIRDSKGTNHSKQHHLLWMVRLKMMRGHNNLSGC